MHYLKVGKIDHLYKRVARIYVARSELSGQIEINSGF